ncbi:hypothetical protein M422DRAFT_32518 [Sphaerobolus stellatus SS14]|uniref:DUF6534 domain-containing protein n=1 Tax=Sphaerobolus stellatus (strain SS14) TaxID=990650 RepID=A0A0C9VQ07_SPHS4|nr:hypothetical protein M422DRAFT_32518 [Sphaerobolus stellatus SS14]
MILYGALVVQSFLYYQTHRKDARWMRYFVLYLVVMETINAAFDMYLIYEPLIQRYDALVTVLISVPVQLFVTWRIKVLSGSNFIPGIIVFFAICSFGGATATTISVSIIREFARFGQFESAVVIWLASSSLADIIITSALVWSLRSRKTGHLETDNVVNKIIVLTIQTGAITALFALLDFVLFLAIPQIYPFHSNFLVDFPLSKLYSNSLLSTLNARAGWSNALSGRRQDNVLFGPGSPSGPSPNSSRNLYSHQRRSIFTSTNIELRVPIATTTIDTILPVDFKRPRDLEAAMGTTLDHMGDEEGGLGVIRAVDRL